MIVALALSLVVNAVLIFGVIRRTNRSLAPLRKGATSKCPSCGQCMQISIARPEGVEPVELEVSVGWMK